MISKPLSIKLQVVCDDKNQIHDESTLAHSLKWNHLATITISSDLSISNFLSSICYSAPFPLSISNYTKDPSILNKKFAKTIFQVKGSTNSENDKIIQFCTYLSDRRKAAIIKVKSTVPDDPVQTEKTSLVSREDAMKEHELFLLPLSHTSRSGEERSEPAIECFSTKILYDIQANNTLSSEKQNKINQSTTPSSSSSSSGGVSNAPDSFLGKLLNKAKATQVARVAPPNLLDHMKQQRLKEIQEFIEKLRGQLKSFVDDDSFLEEVLEPMDKEHRQIVHEVAEDFPELLAKSIGEEPDRSVLVYRRNHRPESLPESIDVIPLSQIQGPRPPRSTAKKTTHGNDLIDISDESLIKLNPAKRDRRSVADVMEDIKRRKMG